MFHLAHAGNQSVIGILLLQFLKFVEKGSVFRTPVSVKEKNAVRPFLLRGIQKNTAKWRDPDPSDQDHGSPGLVIMKFQVAEGTIHLYFRAQGEIPQHPFESRVPQTGRHHEEVFIGCVAIEKTRELPSASISGGFSNVISMNWPGANAREAGFSKRKAMVCSATSWRLFSFMRKVGLATVALILFAS